MEEFEVLPSRVGAFRFGGFGGAKRGARIFACDFTFSTRTDAF